MPRTTPTHPILTTPRLRLRSFRPDDAEGLHACLADAEAMRYWDTPPHGKLLQTARVVGYWTKSTPDYHRSWAIADGATDACIGMVNYHGGHVRNRRASIGYILAPARHRQGLGAEAVGALLHHCFTERRFHRLEAFIHPDNAASRGLAQSLGFRLEGHLRDHMRVGEEWRDALIYGLLARDWKAGGPLNE